MKTSVKKYLGIADKKYQDLSNKTNLLKNMMAFCNFINRST